jgi:hypothetical protein
VLSGVDLHFGEVVGFGAAAGVDQHARVGERGRVKRAMPVRVPAVKATSIAPPLAGLRADRVEAGAAALVCVGEAGRKRPLRPPPRTAGEARIGSVVGRKGKSP